MSNEKSHFGSLFSIPIVFMLMFTFIFVECWLAMYRGVKRE
jgi:hypothetical protein